MDEPFSNLDAGMRQDERQEVELMLMLRAKDLALRRMSPGVVSWTRWKIEAERQCCLSVHSILQRFAAENQDFSALKRDAKVSLSARDSTPFWTLAE